MFLISFTSATNGRVIVRMDRGFLIGTVTEAPHRVVQETLTVIHISPGDSQG